MPDSGLGSWPRRAARIRPTSVALRQGDRSLTYTELAARVDNSAHAMAALGIGRGDRIAYLGHNDIAAFEIFFAAGRLGALFVPLNTRLTAPEISRLLADSAPRLLLHGPEHAPLVSGSDVEFVIPIEQWDPPRIASGAAHLIADIGPDVGLDDPAVLLYTSGTTGTPKAAVLTHGNLTFNTVNQLAHIDVLADDVALCLAPLFHATGLGLVSLPTLFKGGTVVVLPRFDPATVLATIAEARVSAFSGVPTMLQMLCDHPDFARTDLGSLRYVIYGGSSVAERVAAAWQRRGVDILHGYGMTEAAPGVCLATAEGAGARPVSAGVPHFFTDIAVDQPAADGSGELLVRGPNVARGYWRRPAEYSFADGWFRSGDVVRVAEDGWIHVVDRIKDIIISGGENIYPAEVEARVNAVAGVVECAVVGVPDERWGEVGVAYVVRAAPDAVTEAELRAALRGTLAAYKIPRHIRFVDRLARNAAGKIQKHTLRFAPGESK
ncbi:fatty-acyl-CoA synthase [Nocardia panacis]|uniref:Fatty-acyl-CoA synthase n=1 Tax=Nocardia panacis TaxID=2340916 RepID=A0A3A4KQ58_9NOCA|nr:long-chain fatty acid--CoA ligase [Nocardia panacis]RJO75150.1 fatty-acyl-CoA synthase [Nocardia panacis]